MVQAVWHTLMPQGGNTKMNIKCLDFLYGFMDFRKIPEKNESISVGVKLNIG